MVGRAEVVNPWECRLKQTSKGGNHDRKEIWLERLEDAYPASQRPRVLRVRVPNLCSSARWQAGGEMGAEDRVGRHFRRLLVGSRSTTQVRCAARPDAARDLIARLHLLA